MALRAVLPYVITLPAAAAQLVGFRRRSDGGRDLQFKPFLFGPFLFAGALIAAILAG